MGESDKISFEELNAFVDGELDLGASARVLAAIDADDELKRQACELRAMRDQLRHAYDIKPANARGARGGFGSGHWRYGIAAGLLGIGILAGWQGHARLEGDGEARWDRFAQLRPQGDTRRLLLHVGEPNLVRFENTLDEARDMIQAARDKGERMEIEILANGPGLDLLRIKTTPVAHKLNLLQNEFPELALVACGQGLQRLRAQGADIELLPGVVTADSALDEIVRRMNRGWAYLRV
jgi:intracellular sulfur oxidation DsrE/DsrF family protein